ncbi:hypothetical protein ZOSMA_17G00190 [Zostera marina]|uniref:Uncharacterized protein n=1 Tax=Zostera marina TaxID=29655 RepID=A0A0K9PQV9_ZOSMR|nr:hypothetical protein ZOSMA_17G00190 [Zostera marina]
MKKIQRDRTCAWDLIEASRRREGAENGLCTDKPAIKFDGIEVDKETIDMLASLGMPNLSGVIKQADSTDQAIGAPFGGRRVGGGGRGVDTGQHSIYWKCVACQMLDCWNMIHWALTELHSRLLMLPVSTFKLNNCK